MNGPDHYREAERLLGLATRDIPDEEERTVVAHAQVHATLALVAATVTGPGPGARFGADVRTWREAVS